MGRTQKAKWLPRASELIKKRQAVFYGKWFKTKSENPTHRAGWLTLVEFLGRSTEKFQGRGKAGEGHSEKGKKRAQAKNLGLKLACLYQSRGWFTNLAGRPGRPEKGGGFGSLQGPTQ